MPIICLFLLLSSSITLYKYNVIIYLSILLLMSTLVVSSVGLLCIKLFWTFWCRNVCGHVLISQVHPTDQSQRVHHPFPSFTHQLIWVAHRHLGRHVVQRVHPLTPGPAPPVASVLRPPLQCFRPAWLLWVLWTRLALSPFLAFRANSRQMTMSPLYESTF